MAEHFSAGYNHGVLSLLGGPIAFAAPEAELLCGVLLRTCPDTLLRGGGFFHKLCAHTVLRRWSDHIDTVTYLVLLK